MLEMIVNPIAGHGRSLEVAKKIEAELQSRNIPYHRVESQYPGHTTQLAREGVLARKAGIISLGGDGTNYEIVDALAGSDIPIYLVPCGTGNDLAKTLQLPKDPIEAFRLQLNSDVTRMDAGQINHIKFANVSGTGLDIDVLKHTIKFKERFHGVLPYLLGIFAAVRHFVPVELEILVQDSVMKKRLTIIEVANGQYIGGGMRVAPTADPTDGCFDVYYVDAIPKHLIWFLLPLFITGWYRYLPITHRMHVDAITLRSRGMMLNVDGELLDVSEARYKLLPGALCIRCPIPAHFMGVKV